MPGVMNWVLGIDLYLFGGRSKLGGNGWMNDLWMFDTMAGNWILLGGSNLPDVNTDVVNSYPGNLGEFSILIFFKVVVPKVALRSILPPALCGCLVESVWIKTATQVNIGQP